MAESESLTATSAAGSSASADEFPKRERRKKKKSSKSAEYGVDDEARAAARAARKAKRSKKRANRSSSSHGLGGAAASLCAGMSPGGGVDKPGAADASSERIGVTLAAIVLALYVFGMVQTIRSVPDVNPNMKRAWLMRRLSSLGKLRGVAGGAFGRFGGNINLSRNGLVGDDEADGGGSADGAIASAAAEAARVGRSVPRSGGGGLRGADKVSAVADDAGASVAKGGGSVVPEAQWPVSIRYEDGNFEDIVHPGDGKTVMSVPKFWSDPIHDNVLMTRERAMQIGSCAEPDAGGSRARGDGCPRHERTIFVAIASYRDWQCRDTINSIFSRAKNPGRVRAAVVDQIIEGEDGPCDSPHKPCSEDPNQALCKYKSQIDVFQVDAPLAVGPVFARHLGHRLYRGEYYAMQSDAHVTFTKDWDVDIIEQMEATGDEMAVLSTYLTDITDSLDPQGNSLRKTRPIMCNTDYEGGQQGKHLRHMSQPEGRPSIHGTPQLQPYWAAGFSYSRGHFVVNVPYDLYQPMIFQGEEMSIGLRGFTIGYDFYAPERSVCFHTYAEGPNAAKRNKVKHFWENSDHYRGVGIKAMKRLLGIVNMNPEVDPSEWDHAEEKKYGLGKVRTTKKFYDTFGINVVKKVTEHNLCQFVATGKMHNQFMRHMRSDGMGIDYSKVKYQFKDPQKQ